MNAAVRNVNKKAQGVRKHAPIWAKPRSASFGASSSRGGLYGIEGYPRPSEADEWCSRRPAPGERQGYVTQRLR